MKLRKTILALALALPLGALAENQDDLIAMDELGATMDGSGARVRLASRLRAALPDWRELRAAAFPSVRQQDRGDGRISAEAYHGGGLQLRDQPASL